MKANILIVDDDESLRRALSDRFSFWGHAPATARSGEEALVAAEQRAFDLILLDLSMPGLGGLEVLTRLKEMGCGADVVVLTAHGSVANAVEAVKQGADDFLSKPADFELLRRVVDRALEKRRLRRVNLALAEQAAGPGLVVGEAESMKRLLETAAQAASSEATILLQGESGTGKQVLAEHIHRLSPRASGPFLHINCVAISDELIESTLFGHEKGAFTGAVGRKPGRLEQAAGGTAFLDEVGDISASLQTKLLHFLETGEFERVGGTQTINVDCRVVAATNRNLGQEVREGRFREDLYYRLNVIALELPPLRDRIEDIPVLAQAFLREFAGELRRDRLEFAPQTLAVFRAYAWPGNVRQLRNAVERMAVLARSDRLTPDLLPPEIRGGGAPVEGSWRDLPYKEALAEFKREIVRGALARHGNNQTRAAEELGLQRTYLNRLIKELGIETQGGPRDETRPGE